MSNFYEEVITVINEIVGDVAIKQEDYDTIFKDLGIDSLDTANILFELEEKYNINFLEEDVENLNTVNAIVKYITENLKQ